jgi:hypothetical protein
MLKTIYSLLSNEELLFLNSMCFPFIASSKFSIINKNNFYIRKILNVKNDLLEYQKNCITHLGGEYEIQGLWINKINVTTNQQDDFHTDDSEISIVTYLNEDFQGGEFEYIFKNKKIKIKPIKNCSLIMDETMQHRVLNVTSGERFSLISFYKKAQKKQKTLL